MKKHDETLETNSQIVMYQTTDGKTSLEVNLQKDTVWLMQKQIAELFGAERSVITKHLQNIFQTRELNKDSVCANFAHTATDGKVMLWLL
ncbi:MAG: hypothetical protein LHV68_12165 [Elusimicrobia bacterium]|nr:hypothetical protein [Candidatus Liberimonas magnetica]